MADLIDINPQRTEELKAHRARLEPILRGLRDKIATPLSAQAKAVLQEQIDVKQRRLNAVYDELAKIEVVNMSHQSLLDDGYPDLLPVVIDATILDELQHEAQDEAAALAIFTEQRAVSFDENVPTIDEQQPVPAQD